MACGKYVKMCAGVARAGLKSFVELVRLQTLSRQGAAAAARWMCISCASICAGAAAQPCSTPQ